ncbi:MAG: valine--tRNA ligase [Rickettsiaceae bacterium]|nr:valine--tRNA ligase [Rickettsiaceae bacterium]
MIDFPAKYNFFESEKKWQQFWQEHKIYQWDHTISRDQTYVIDTPPPTVSGQLHIGHVFSYTHTDFIARYQRMKGMNVFYPIGFDDNGLPTERLVEKKKNIRANQLKRQEFIDICKEVIEEEEEKFKELFDSIALSVDWDTKYCTINPLSIKISQMSFLDLINKGQIYRDSQPMLWDPVDKTALAQADIEEHEKTTFMNDIIFRTEDDEDIIIATTRPELLPACVAIFYHPDDEKYQNLKDKFALSPLFNVKVPILPDDMVDPEKGTGLVMCCTFGDQTDILWWRRHKLPTKIIFTENGRIIDNIPFDQTCTNITQAQHFASMLSGLKIKQAREQIIHILKEEKLLISQTEKLQLVKCAERSGTPLEILTTPQWFVRAIDHKEELIKKSNELRWHPSSMKIKLDNWINGVSLDWCISRQRYFGVPFPVWYSKRKGEEGKIILASLDQLPVDPLKDLPQGYKREEVEADKDVMDTWSTSSVSPQLNSHGISTHYMENASRHKSLFPADLRPQAHEILRTWAYYTMLKAHLHEDTLPWHNIMVSGWCLAEDKTKMSKSKGNIISPVQLVQEFGADIIRYWSSNARLGADTAYSSDIMKNGRRLVNKLYNAAKFTSQYFGSIPDNIKQQDFVDAKHLVCCDIDKYFLIKLSDLIAEVTHAFDNYEYATAISKSEHFFWNIFCDNYLEIVKTRAYNEDNNNHKGAQSAHITLYYAFKVLLKLFAPFLPHITEELYNLLYASNESIHAKSSWPHLEAHFDQFDHTECNILFSIIELVRKIKARDNLSIKAGIKYIEITKQINSVDLIQDLKNVISAKEIKFTKFLSDQSQDLSINDLYINVVYDKD